MMPTGIFRRVDDLGRVVISKRVREIAGIKENDPLETFYERYDTDRYGNPVYQIVFRPYKPELEDE